MKKIILSIAIVSSIFSCTDDFENINTNMNDAVEVGPESLMTTVIFNLANKYGDEGYDFGEILPQYGAYYEYNSLDIYNWGADDTFWEMYDYLEDVDDIKDKALAANNDKLVGTSLILESFMMSVITDAYGYAPYSEALQADEGIYAPKYDSQEEIYNQIFENLTQANTLLDGEGTIVGDILFGGNELKWKKFCNSLHLRLLMRTSYVQDVSSQVAEIYNSSNDFPLIQSNNENAAYEYEGSYPNASPISSAGQNRAYSYELIVPTTTLIETLQDNNDPRLFEWVDPQDGTDNYIGLEPGLPLDQIGEDVEYARRAKSYYNDGSKMKAYFITYSEVNFLLSEAADRGMISADAEDLYNTAVEASFVQWNVNMPNDYLTNQAPYSEDNFWEQKWLGLYHTGVEAWFDWKRTGKPEFIQPGQGAQIGEVPRRLIYPSIEQSINSQNYQEAIGSMGGDNITTKIWWDNF